MQMKIKIKVHANSSKEEIKKIDENNYEVWIKEKPIDNRANKSLLKLLENYFKKSIKIKFGFNSRKKIIEIDN
jgi:uncharacterized protein